MNLSELLNNSTAPVILISGVGILLLVISNRIMHVSDRLRSIMQQGYSPRRQIQVDVLHHRAQILRGSIVSLCSSVFCSGVMLVLTVLRELDVMPDNDWLIGLLLILSTLAIAIASGGLLHDVVLSLRALEMEIKDYVTEKKTKTMLEQEDTA